MISSFKNSLPLVLIAGVSHAVNLDPDCASQGSGGHNDVDVGVDFNVKALHHDHHDDDHHHDHLSAPLSLEVSNILSAMAERQQEIEQAAAVEDALRKYKSEEKARIRA